jgi:hypothetical protein
MLLDRLKGELVDAAEAAAGHERRRDPVLPRTGGPAGNARLTAWTGLVLFVLFVAELVTLLDVRGLISWHVVLGVLLVPPALLKTASTGWRILRYYTGQPGYRSAGPPPLPLRVLGPLVVATTLLLLGSGLLLILVGDQRSRQPLVTVLGQRVDLLSLHQASFILCAIALGLHVLARAVPALSLTVGWAPGRRIAREPVPGVRPRLAVVTATLAIAAVTAALLLPLASGWQDDRFAKSGHDRPPGAVQSP